MKNRRSEDSDALKTAVFRNCRKKWIAWLTAVLFVLQPLTVAAQLAADPNAGANRPTIDAAANGVPLVQIASPSQAGVSHNKYIDFNVDPHGLILNNSGTNVLTQLGGYVAGNPFLANGSARVILNEVTSSSVSSLRGYTEVAGQRAEVVIANPNGISCDGCGFINASRSTLTTGTPVFGGAGSLDAFRVTGGSIDIRGAGLDASTVDQVDLISRAVRIQAEVWGKILNVVTGANRVQYADLGVQVIQGEGDRPTVSLDVALLGGMYAGKIRLIGTEAGLGVNSMGTIAARNGDLVVSQEGRVILAGDTSAKGNIDIAATDGFTNTGILYGYQNASFNTQGALQNTGTIAAGGNLYFSGTSISSTGVLGSGIDFDGSMRAAGDMTITVSGSAVLKNQTIAGGNLFVSAAGIDMSDSKTQAGGNATLTTASGGIDNTCGMVGVNGQVSISALSLDNTGGQIWTGGDMSITADSGVNNTGGTIFSYGNLTANLASSSLINTDGGIGAGIDLKVFAGSVINSGGQMAADRDVAINAASLSGSGEVVAGRDLTINLAGDFTNEAGGSLKANRSLTLATPGAIANYGSISAVETADISGGSLANEAGATVEANDLNLNFTDAVINHGLISGCGAVNINTNSFSNSAAVFADSLQITADSILNEGEPAILGATSLMNLYAASSLTNKDGATIYSLGDINIAGKLEKDDNGDYLYRTATILNQSATIEAENDLVIYADEITNKKRIFVTGQGQEGEPSYHEQDIQGTSQLPWPEPTFWAYLRYWETITQTKVLEDSAPGMILSGRNMTLKGAITNYLSTIAAGGSLSFDVSTLNNIGVGAARLITRNGDYWFGADSFFGMVNPAEYGATCWGGDFEGLHCTIPYHEQTSETLAGWSSVISAGTSISGTAQTINNGMVNPDGSPIGSFSSTLPPGTVTPKPADGAPQTTPGTFTLPQNGLYHICTDPERKYLVETDPRFVDYRIFLSSDYMLQRLAYNMETAEKRLGDGFYEQKLVRDQVMQLTGRRYLEGYAGAEDQFKGLMNNAVLYAKDFNLQVGVALTAEQMTRLTSDIVWLEERVVQGQKVLAPVVYLSKVNAEDLRPTGALIAANDINLVASDTLTNMGTIKGGVRTSLAANTIFNRGGMIDSGNLTRITASQDILNQSGTINGGNVSLNAGRDIRNETLSESVSGGGKRTTTLINDTAKIQSRGDLMMQAGQDIGIKGGNITAQDEAVLVAGRDINANTVAHNQRVAVGGFSLSSTKHLSSELETQGSLSITAANDASFMSAKVNVGNDLSLYAGGDVNIVAAKDNFTSGGAQFYKYVENTTHVASDIQTGGNLNLNSGNDTVLRGTQVTAGKDLNLVAGGNVSISAVKDSSISNIQLSSRDFFYHSYKYDEKVIGSNLGAGGNLLIAAAKGGDGVRSDGKGNVTIAGSNISSKTEAIGIAADRDVNIKEETERHESLLETRKTSGGFFSSSTTETRDWTLSMLSRGSALSGESVTVGGGNDLLIRGSSLVATNDVMLAAKNNVDITTSQETRQEEHMRRESKSGFMSSGGLGFTIGSQSQKSTMEEQGLTQVGSTIGSILGRVDIASGKDTRIIGSDIISATGTSITGRNVRIDSAYNTLNRKETFEASSSGLTIGIVTPGGIIETAMKANNEFQRSQEVKDSRLSALYKFKAADDLAGAGVGALKIADNLGSGNMDMAKLAPTLTISFGSSSSRSETVSQSKEARGSSIVSSGDIHITAAGEKGADGTILPDRGNLDVVGSVITGKSIFLTAANDIHLTSAENTSSTRSSSSSDQGSIGVNISPKGVSATANVAMSRGNSDGDTLTHVNTKVTADEILEIKSGRDTNMLGAIAKGDRILAEIGRNLNMASRQDTDNFKSRNDSFSAGATVPITGGNFGANLSFSKGKVDSEYRSVVEQTGLYAGKGGYDINVENNTDLKGAVIDSTADPEKNRISTGTLTYGNIQNKAEYSASTIGISAGYGVDDKGKGHGLVLPNIGVPSGGSASSTTYAVISPGTIEIRSNPSQDISGLSRSPETAHRTLEKIFDAEKVAEQQELSRVFGEEAFKLVGGVSAVMGWEEGSREKIILHAITGAIQASLGGGNILAGALGAGTAEASRSLTENLGKAQQQWISAAIGAAAGGITGGGSLSALGTGAATGLDGERYNRQPHEDEKAVVRDLAKKGKSTESRLEAAACYMVKCGDELPDGTPGKDTFLAMQREGANYVDEQEMLMDAAYDHGMFMPYTPWDWLSRKTYNWSVVAGVGGSATAITGAEGSVGLYLKPGIGNSQFEIGAFGSGGVGSGLNVGASAFVGIMRSDVKGTVNANLGIWNYGAALYTDSRTGEFAGLTFGPSWGAKYAIGGSYEKAGTVPIIKHQ